MREGEKDRNRPDFTPLRERPGKNEPKRYMLRVANIGNLF